jgi:hypothetical protein
MEQATATRCPGCGYENNPFFRYCGMCGTPLRAGDPPLPPVPQEPFSAMPQAAFRASEPIAPVEAPLPERKRNSPPIAIGGLSILGLGDPDADGSVEDSRATHFEEPASHSNANASPQRFAGALGLLDTDDRLSSSDVRYLLEDDEPRRAHWRVFIALLLLFAAIGALVWHWQTNGYPWESAVADQAHKTGLAEDKPPVPGASETPSSPAPQTPPENAPKPDAVAAVNPAPAPPEPESVSPDGLPAARTAGVAPAPQEEAVPPVKQPPPPVARKPLAAIPAPQARPVAPAPLNDPAQVFAEGEKYLYGDGVPRDCDRAQRDLRTSAAHSYPPAESLLGTMYASGHCLGRDLPAAYRWYARALHHDPGNSRLSSDLEILWKQMTPAERKAAQAGAE